MKSSAARTGADYRKSIWHLVHALGRWVWYDPFRVSTSMFSTIGINAVKFRVVVHSAVEGGFWAEIPALAGCVSEGETLAETLANIREAAEGWLEVAGERIQHDADAQLAEIEL